MINFLENLLGIVLIFSFFLWIYNPNASVFELISGLFMGMINKINRILQNMKKL